MVDAIIEIWEAMNHVSCSMGWATDGTSANQLPQTAPRFPQAPVHQLFNFLATTPEVGRGRCSLAAMVVAIMSHMVVYRGVEGDYKGIIRAS